MKLSVLLLAAGVTLVPMQAQGQETEGWHNRLVGYNRDGTAHYVRVYCRRDGRCYRPRRQEYTHHSGTRVYSYVRRESREEGAYAAKSGAPWAISTSPWTAQRGPPTTRGRGPCVSISARNSWICRTLGTSSTPARAHPSKRAGSRRSAKPLRGARSKPSRAILSGKSRQTRSKANSRAWAERKALAPLRSPGGIRRLILRPIVPSAVPNQRHGAW